MAEVEQKPEYTIEIWFGSTKYLTGIIIGKEETMIGNLFTLSRNIFDQYELALQQEFRMFFKRTK